MPEHVGSPARSKVTDTIEVIDGTGLHVAFAGDKCALHVFTRSGIRRVVLPLHVFIEHARCPRDGNGNPFPIVSPRRRDDVERELEADSAQMPDPARVGSAVRVAEPAATDGVRPLVSSRAPAPAPASSKLKRAPWGTYSQLCERAWKVLAFDPARTVREVAIEHSLKPATLHSWICDHHAGELSEMRRILRLPLYGHQSTPNHNEAAARGLPLRKPNGSL